MKPIQVVLFVLVVGGIGVYFRRLRSRLLDRVVVLILGVCGLVLVAVPDWSNTLAQLFGVHRGADLVIYLGLVGLAWLWLLLFSKLRETESRLTELARNVALERARPAAPGSRGGETTSATVPCTARPDDHGGS